MGRTLERISVFIRGRLPQRRSPEQDRHLRAADLIAQLPSEDNVTSARLMRSIRRLSPDADLGWDAQAAWGALTEARSAQEREPDQDYSELIGQTQLQHGYAFARELEVDAKRARTIKTVKDIAWALTIVGPIASGVIEIWKAGYEEVNNNYGMARALREAERQDLRRGQ